jgi:uncharacterized cupredoxin-like copper-binding protein
MIGAILNSKMEEAVKKIVFNILVFALLVTACGGTSTTPAPIPTEVMTESSSTPTPPIVASAMPEETTQPVQNTDGKVQVEVTLGDNWVKSDLTTFKVGVTYVFTVTNTGRRAHIFSISRPVTEITGSGINAAKAESLVLVSQDQLSPGAVVTVEYTFTQPAPAGTLEFACLILMHYKMGQYLPIVVE